VGSLVRLNLGCGDKLWPGFVNVDFPGNFSGVKPDVECDITKLTFPDDYADEIHSIHVIEHLDRPGIGKVVREWRRVLKPGGKLVIECPCLDKIRIHLYSMPPKDIHWLRLTMVGLYGEYWRGVDDENTYRMLHRWCYSAQELINILTKSEFKEPTLMDPLFHQRNRDMRVEARK
jgi:predicted SAM-dependent methyltransferase